MKILLVDDELPIRSYLRTLVDWESHGYQLVEAENGSAAVELLKAGGIRMMLLDITMPVMSGLEVLEWMQDNGVKSVVTLLTNHDEFSFAQKALRLGCFDYVLKTDITGERILALVERMRRELSEQDQQEQQRDALEAAARRKTRSELQNSVNYWLHSDHASDAGVLRRFRTQLGFEDSRCRYALLEIAIHDYSAVVDRYTDSDIVQFTQVFDGVLNELLESHTFFFTEPQKGIFLVFLRFSRQDSVQSILTRTQRLSMQIDHSFRSLLGIHSTIIYSLPFSFLRDARDRYRQMEQLRPHAFFQPSDRIYCLQDYNMETESCRAILSEFEEQFAAQLRSRNLLEIESCFDDAVNRIVTQRYCVDPAAFTRSCGQCAAAFLGDQRLAASEPVYEDCAALKKALVAVLEPHCLSNEDQDKNLLIKKALLLIQQHYSEDIGLEWLASQLWVNASYLSRVFSQEVGQPFTAYLNRYRIEQAKRLILSSNLKLCEVAEQTGFSSSIVFSRSFKKVTGKTPSEFRSGTL